MRGQAKPAQPAPGLWFHTWKVWLAARPLLTAALAELGLDHRDFWMLAIAQHAPLRQHELASVCGLDPSTLVALIDRLERRGWVRRRRDPRDRRAHLVGLTAAGRALYHRALPLAQRAEADQMRVLTASERRRLIQLLRKLGND